MFFWKFLDEIDPDRIEDVSIRVGQWRKANAIHNWFVKNVQGGDDNCNEYLVTESQLKTLLDLVEHVIAESDLVDGKVGDGYTFKNGEKIPQFIEGKIIKDPTIAKTLLPTTEGFFNGQTREDQFYIEDLKLTKKILKESIQAGGDIYYKSSW